MMKFVFRRRMVLFTLIMPHHLLDLNLNLKSTALDNNNYYCCYVPVFSIKIIFCFLLDLSAFPWLDTLLPVFDFICYYSSSTCIFYMLFILYHFICFIKHRSLRVPITLITLRHVCTPGFQVSLQGTFGTPVIRVI